ncbi:hypothetical protein L1987_32497 [Smallanthus sonchifolius]|uniref:Uncharacterized protein n=1 Tax=Smallanthus sonchifolius TaxID=185202 RepID=A0ACB9HN60_9ASTR|nr:hypothetical protein L1987_32497 [Smallanthus sonchifolius]
MMYSPKSLQMSHAMASLPLARIIGMTTPMNVSCPIPTTQHPGFTYPHMVNPQLVAYMMAQYANPWQTTYCWQYLVSGTPTFQHAAATRTEAKEIFRPYRSTSSSCFSKRIANFVFPMKIKMPAKIKIYDGTNDPEDHLQVFSGATGVERWINAECCHMFMQTLIGSARLWFSSLPERSIDSFDDLSQRFRANFTQVKKYTKDAAVLYQIKQKEDEGFRSFIDRYKKEGLPYARATEKMWVSGFMNTMDKALERAEAYLREKEAFQNLESKRRDPWKNYHSSGLKPKFHSFVDRRSNRHHDLRKTEDRYRPPYRKNTPEKEKYIAFTALPNTPEEIMTTEEARYRFRPLRPLVKSSEGRSSRELAYLVKDIKRKNDPKGKVKVKEMKMIHLTISETQKRPRRES